MRDDPANLHSPRGTQAVLILLAALVSVTGLRAERPQVIDVLIALEGLPPLHTSLDDKGQPLMKMPQFRLFDGDGRPLWSFDEVPRDFAKQLEERITTGEPIPEGRTFRQEARHFLRRGGLPLNLTTLPATEITVVEYWTDGCSSCRRLTRDIRKFFAKRDGPSVKIVRVFIDFGREPRRL